MYSVVALGTVVFAVAGRDVALEGVQVGAADGGRVDPDHGVRDIGKGWFGYVVERVTTGTGLDRSFHRNSLFKNRLQACV